MNWRFQKSIKLGKHLRVTGSKSGMGMSWGVPGFRVGKSSAGEWSITLGVPKTGLSFKQVVWPAGTPPVSDVSRSSESPPDHGP